MPRIDTKPERGLSSLCTARDPHVDRMKQRGSTELARLFAKATKGWLKKSNVRGESPWLRTRGGALTAGFGSERGVDSWVLVSGVLAQDARP